MPRCTTGSGHYSPMPYPSTHLVSRSGHPAPLYHHEPSGIGVRVRGPGFGCLVVCLDLDVDLDVDLAMDLAMDLGVDLGMDPGVDLDMDLGVDLAVSPMSGGGADDHRMMRLILEQLELGHLAPRFKVWFCAYVICVCWATWHPGSRCVHVCMCMCVCVCYSQVVAWWWSCYSLHDPAPGVCCSHLPPPPPPAPPPCPPGGGHHSPAAAVPGGQ